MIRLLTFPLRALARHLEQAWLDGVCQSETLGRHLPDPVLTAATGHPVCRFCRRPFSYTDRS